MEEHERCIELISLKIDGLLDGDGERELAEHIAACPECNELYEIMTRAHGALGFEVEPPAELLTNVMESVRRKKAAGSRARRRWVGFAGAFAVAAAVLALAVIPGRLQNNAKDNNSNGASRSGSPEQYNISTGTDETAGQDPAVCMAPPESGITAFSLTDRDFDELVAACYAVVYFSRFPEDVEPCEPVTFTNGAAGRYITPELLEKYEPTADRVDYPNPDSDIIIAVIFPK